MIPIGTIIRTKGDWVGDGHVCKIISAVEIDPGVQKPHTIFKDGYHYAVQRIDPPQKVFNGLSSSEDFDLAKSEIAKKWLASPQ